MLPSVQPENNLIISTTNNEFGRTETESLSIDGSDSLAVQSPDQANPKASQLNLIYAANTASKGEDTLRKESTNAIGTSLSEEKILRRGKRTLPPPLRTERNNPSKAIFQRIKALESATDNFGNFGNIISSIQELLYSQVGEAMNQLMRAIISHPYQREVIRALQPALGNMVLSKVRSEENSHLIDLVCEDWLRAELYQQMAISGVRAVIERIENPKISENLKKYLLNRCLNQEIEMPPPIRRQCKGWLLSMLSGGVRSFYNDITDPTPLLDYVSTELNDSKNSELFAQQYNTEIQILCEQGRSTEKPEIMQKSKEVRSALFNKKFFKPLISSFKETAYIDDEMFDSLDTMFWIKDSTVVQVSPEQWEWWISNEDGDVIYDNVLSCERSQLANGETSYSQFKPSKDAASTLAPWPDIQGIHKRKLEGDKISENLLRTIIHESIKNETDKIKQEADEDINHFIEARSNSKYSKKYTTAGQVKIGMYFSSVLKKDSDNVQVTNEHINGIYNNYSIQNQEDSIKAFTLVLKSAEALRYSSEFGFGDGTESITILRQYAHNLFLEARKLGLNKFVSNEDLIKWDQQFSTSEMCGQTLYRSMNQTLRGLVVKIDKTRQFAPNLFINLYKQIIPLSWRMGSDNNIVASYSAQNGVEEWGCYGKSALAMLVDKKELDQYLNTLKKINAGGNGDLINLKDSIKKMHYYLNEEYGLKEGDLKYSLGAVINNLKQNSNKKSYIKLGTPNHAMGIKVEDGEYIFLDFNSKNGTPTILKARSLNDLHTQLKNYFTRDRLTEYQLHPKKSLFEYKEMNIGFLKNIPLAISGDDNQICYVSAEQLAKTTNPEQLISNAKKSAQETYAVVDVLKKERITDYALGLPQELEKSTEKLFKENKQYSPKDYIIDFLRIEKVNEIYKIPLIHSSGKSTPYYLTSPDPIFNRAKEFIAQHSQIVGRSLSNLTSRYQVKYSTLGMSSAFAVKYFFDWYMRDKSIQESEAPIGAGLKVALQAHAYVNVAQVSQGAIHEAIEVAEVVKGIKNGFSEGAQIAPRAMEVFGKFALLLNIAALGLETYELTQVEDSDQKVLFGTQLGVDIATMLVGFVCSPLTVPLMGLGVGATALAESYINLARRWKKVGEYFAQLKQAYSKGYEYDSKTNTLKFLPGGVIAELDLTKDRNQIKFGSQYLYTAPSRYYGHGALFDDAGNDDGTRENAIPIRDAIAASPTLGIEKNSSKAAVIVLPSTPPAYIAWHREMVASLRDCHGAGFDVLSQIENYSKEHPLHKHIFQNEHRFLLFEKYIDEIFPAANPADVRIVLDNQERIIVMPEAADTPIRRNRFASVTQADYQKNLFTYYLENNGGKCIVSLNQQGKLKLSSKTEGAKWVLDARKLKNEDVKIETGRITIGGVKIDIDPSLLSKNSQLQIVTNEATLEIDLKTNTSRILSANAAIWNKNHQQTIDAYLQQEAQQHHLLGQYFPVTQYDHNKDGNPEGLAYYDIEQKRMLFSINSVRNNINMVYSGVLQEGKLGAVIGDDVYFYYNYNTTSKFDIVKREKASYVWKVDAKSGRLKDFYSIPVQDVTQDTIQVWQEGGKVFMSRGEKDNTSIFALQDNQPLQLVSQEQPVDNVKDINFSSSFLSKKMIKNIKHYQVQDDQFVVSPYKETTQAPLVAIYGKDKNKSTYRCWIKSASGQQNMIVPHIMSPTPQTAEHLVLCHIVQEEGKDRYFYFFDPVQKALYFQEGPGTSPSPIKKANRLNTPISNVYSNGQELFALTEEGLIYRVAKDGQLILESASQNWLYKQGKDWYKKLNNLPTTNNKPLPIYGLKGADKKNLLVWYYQGKLIFSPNLQGKDLQLVQTDANFAYFFDAKNGKLYQQFIANDATLSTAFDNDYSLLSNHRIAAVRELFPTEKFKTVWTEQGNIKLLTQDGVILMMKNADQLVWVGLDKTWEKASSSSIAELAKKWTFHSQYISIESSYAVVGKWYDFDSNRLISAPLGASDQAEYLGSSSNGKNRPYFFINSNKGLFEFTLADGETSLQIKKMGSLEAHRIEENTVLLKGSPKDDILQPLPVQNIQTTLLYGGGSNDTYILKKEVREKGKHFIINNFSSSDKKNDILQLELKDYYNAQLFRRDDHLMIADAKGTIQIENVFGPNRDNYLHLTIQCSFENNPNLSKSYQLSRLIQFILNQTDNINSLTPLSSVR